MWEGITPKGGGGGLHLSESEVCNSLYLSCLVSHHVLIMFHFYFPLPSVTIFVGYFFEDLPPAKLVFEYFC
jgi:hypothetical protein